MFRNDLQCRASDNCVALDIKKCILSSFASISKAVYGWHLALSMCRWLSGRPRNMLPRFCAQAPDKLSVRKVRTSLLERS